MASDKSWEAPYNLTSEQESIPPGSFLLPLCLTPARYQTFINALYAARGYNTDPANYADLTHIIDVLEAQAHIDRPWDSACWPDLCDYFAELAGENGDGRDLLEAIDAQCGTNYRYIGFCEAVVDCLETTVDVDEFLACLALKLLQDCIGYNPPKPIPEVPTLCDYLDDALGANANLSELVTIAENCGIVVTDDLSTVSDDMPIGSLLPNAAQLPLSSGYLPMDGTTYLKADYPDLWNHLSGLTGGGWGLTATEFTLPDMSDSRSVVGASVNADSGDVGGNATTTLTENNLPETNHDLRQSLSVGTNTNNAVRGGTYDSNSSVAILDSGISLPFSNMPPYLRAFWHIKYTDTVLPPGATGADGIDGASPELRVNSGFVQWRQDDDSPTWTNLIDLSTLTGSAGDDGASVELRVVDNVLEWRQDDDDPTWTPLYVLNTLKGEPGEPGDSIQGEKGDPGDCDCDVPSETFGEDGNDKRCNIASYYSDILFRDLVTTVISESENENDVAQLLGILLGLAIFLPGVGATAAVYYTLSGGLVGLASFIVGRDLVQLENDFTELFWQNVKCAVYDVMPVDGVITETVKNNIVNAVESLSGSGDAPEFLSGLLERSSLDYFNDGAEFGVLYAGDCSLCQGTPWCYELDFTVDEMGFAADGNGSSVPRGAWSPAGWSAVDYTVNGGADPLRAIRINRNFGGIEADTVEIEFEVVPGNQDEMRVSGGGISYQTESASTLGGSITLTVADTLNTLTLVGVVMEPGQGSGSFVFKKLIFRGYGTNPFGSDNCV